VAILRRLRTMPFFGIPTGGDPRGDAVRFAETFADETERCLREADAILAGTVRLFGRDVALGPDGPRWHHDWSTGDAFPLVFYRDVATDASNASAKRVWELNRQQFLTVLGRAYWLTSEERYAARAVGLMGSWIDENPPYVGINWKEALESAIRLVSWIWTLRLISPSDALTESNAPQIVAAIVAQRDHVARHLSTYSSPNTHLLGEALGLLVVGLALPDLPGAEAGVRVALDVLTGELDRQIADDGSHREKSIYYHCYALEMYLLASALASQHGLDASGWRRRVEPMAEFLLWTTRPDGSIARFGDDDGGRVLWLGSHDHYRSTDLLGVSAVMFDRGDFKHVAAATPEQIFWLFGWDGVQTYRQMTATAPPQSSRHFERAGIGIARTGWSSEALWLAFQSDPVGFSTAGHSHEGFNSFELVMDGCLTVIDPGTYTYSGREEWRDHFRTARAHNGVEIDDDRYLLPDGPFGWRNVAALRRLDVPNTSGSPLRAGFERRAPSGVSVAHRRSWHVESSRALRITDEFDGGGRHRLQFWFHFPPEARISVLADDRVGVALPSGAAIELVLEGFADPHPVVHEGWASPGFDRKVPAPTLSIADDATFPARRNVRLTRV